MLTLLHKFGKKPFLLEFGSVFRFLCSYMFGNLLL